MTAEAEIGEEDHLRADLYALLSGLLSAPPDAATLDQLAGIQGDESELGQNIALLARMAGNITPRDAEREYNALFIGLTRGELLPFASYYLTGFLNEKPLAVLRQDMTRLGIEKSGDHSEPEDHIATLLEIMAGLIRGQFAAPICLNVQKEFFTAHLKPWAEHFFSDLEKAKGSALYVPVGRIGRIFMEIEDQAFRMES
ncbi:TorD/DmsD family molecular chaperone [Marimonas arenosa]|uniref:Molecular chaperone TorD family protein n=1 Tax=Marimonas arenosa TaxID=1795305 RepID=A0AAE3WGN3_9RHOB|nr:molecular chaperone TorD family protein [Marimonas arenosa]MDQ2092183.1 molecular chaperone TorD family protein [Marimonas arenosa]